MDPKKLCYRVCRADNIIMVVQGALNNLAASAVSFTMAGNTGILPFLSMFVIGIVERNDPTILNMSGWTEQLLSSWWGITFFGMMTVLEFISMCIPVVDEIVDSIMTFIIPALSILATMSTFGIYNLPTAATNVITNTTAAVAGAGGAARQLNTVTTTEVVEHVTLGFQIFMIVLGILLSLCIHAFKMIVRLIGEGWLTYCLTVIETTWCVLTILIAIFIRPVAIAIAATMIFAAIYGIAQTIRKRNERNQERLVQQTTTTTTYGTAEP